MSRTRKLIILFAFIGNTIVQSAVFYHISSLTGN